MKPAKSLPMKKEEANCQTTRLIVVEHREFTKWVWVTIKPDGDRGLSYSQMDVGQHQWYQFRGGEFTTHFRTDLPILVGIGM